MRKADQSAALAREGKAAEARAAIDSAFELAQRAAAEVSAADIPEPSRSVFHRSAAALASRAGRADEARRLAEIGLQGNPRPEIRSQLEDLLRGLDKDADPGR